MSIIESLNNTSNKAADSGKQLYETTTEYYKLKAFKHVATTTGMFGKILVVGCLLFLSFAFFMVAATIYLGEFLNNIVLSCLIMGGVLLIFTFILYKLRKRIDNMVVRKLSPKFFN